MAKTIETHRYTEYTHEIVTGTVITQVPEEQDMPVQIIIRTGKETILKLDELEEISEAVADALKQAGWRVL